MFRRGSVPATRNLLLSPPRRPRGSRRLPKAPRGSQKLPEAPRGSQRLPEAPRGSQKRLPEAPRGSQRLPEVRRGSQRLPEAPRSSQRFRGASIPRRGLPGRWPLSLRRGSGPLAVARCTSPGTIIGPEGGWGAHTHICKDLHFNQKSKKKSPGRSQPFFLEIYSLTFRRPEFPVPTDQVEECSF
jgi:hypothetical protein